MSRLVVSLCLGAWLGSGCAHMKRPTPYTPKPLFANAAAPSPANTAPGSAENADAAAPPFAPNAAPATPSASVAGNQAALPAGAALPELVGKWCYMSNINSNDGGRQSNTCFQLNADGSYQYHSETSSSGQYGGTASQSDDEGRWQAVGTTLRAQSVSGKVSTYTFEKKNHPKTNDPMLVFDGQAFVTYYQKPPW